MSIKKYIFLYLIVGLHIFFYALELNAHNQINGGCSKHCDHKKQSIFEKKSTTEIKDNYDSENDLNSCLKKSLCRG